MPQSDHNIGRVVQVIGPVVDVEFPEHHLPAIYTPSASPTKASTPKTPST